MCGALPPTHGKQQPVLRIYVRAQTCRCFLSPRKQTRRLPSDASVGRSSPAAAEQESLASPVHSAAHAVWKTNNQNRDHALGGTMPSFGVTL